ncbi:MAG: homocysteine S-methyltransferase family protein [Sedimentisphaerales bacterium]|nr:homocysteine S-methyltransferase family protein [Sedimentisphaerales bacterium]
MQTKLRDKIGQGVFILDGGMGTQLIARGVNAGTCNDYLNIEAPDVISEIHRAYLQAGSNAVTTNTFGANEFALKRHGLADEIEMINKTGAQIARRAAGQDNYVLGDIGPTGDFLEPLGALKPAECKDVFARQAEALIAGGADGLIIETMTAIDEITIAIEAAKSVCGDVPVFASMSFDKAGNDFRTMMGVDVNTMAQKIVPLGIEAIGFNCGTATLDEYIELANKLFSAAKKVSDDVLVFAQPNAGKPELIDGKAVYKVSPEDFAAAAEKIFSIGINIIGGCCGTGPEHIAAFAEKIKISR